MGVNSVQKRLKWSAATVRTGSSRKPKTRHILLYQPLDWYGQPLAEWPLTPRAGGLRIKTGQVQYLTLWNVP
jgi:hypothetical protein